MLDNVLVALRKVAKERGQHSWDKHLTVKVTVVTFVSLTEVTDVACCGRQVHNDVHVVD